MMLPLYDKVTPDTSRGLTAALWRQSLESYQANDPTFGLRLKTSFENESLKTSNGTTNQLTGTTAVTAIESWTAQDAVTAGGTYTVSMLDQEGGWLNLASDSTTADMGVEVGRTNRVVVLPSATTLPSVRTVMENRIDNVSADVFMLLLVDAAYNTPVCGDNAVADCGYIGFRVNEAGDLLFVSKSAAAGTAQALTVIAAASFTATGVHKLGWAVNQDLSIDIVVDGVWYRSVARTSSSAALPTGVLAPRYCASVGNTTTAPVLKIDGQDIFAAAA